MIRLIQSIPFPQPEELLSESETIEEVSVLSFPIFLQFLSQLYSSDDVMPQNNTKQIFEKVENMIRTRENSPETVNTEEEEKDWKAQFIELEATLDIPRVSKKQNHVSFFKRNKCL